MKRLAFCLMAFALICATVLTSCHKDDDDDVKKDNNSGNAMANITASGDISFLATAFSKSASANDASASGTDKSITDIFKSNKDRITIYGMNTNKQFMSITVNAPKGGTGTFHEGLSTTDILIQYLQGGSITDALKNSVDALIIYKESADANDANSSSFWFSTSADVTIDNNIPLGGITYMTGHFSATLMNSSKATKTISGTFTCPGI